MEGGCAIKLTWMKQILLLITYFPLALFAQKRDSVAMPKANRIIISTNKPANENYKLLQTAFVNGGYTIDIKNDDSLLVQTAETRGNSVAISYHLNGIARENEIILYGKYSAGVDASIGGTGTKVFVYDIANTGKKGTASRSTFEAMNDIAKLFNRKIYYMIIDAKKASIFR